MKEKDYIKLFDGGEIRRISKVLDITDLDEKLNDYSLTIKDVVMMLANKVESTNQSVERAADAVRQSIEERNKMKEALELATTCNEYSIKMAGQLLGDNNLYEKVNSGQVTLDKVLMDVINLSKKKGIESFTKQSLTRAGFQLQGNEGADEIISKLIIKIDSYKKRIDSLTNEKSLLESKMSMMELSDSTIHKLSLTLPKQFDSETLKLERDQKNLNVDDIIMILLEYFGKLRDAAMQYKQQAIQEQKKQQAMIEHEKQRAILEHDKQTYLKEAAVTSLSPKEAREKRDRLIIKLYKQRNMTLEQIGDQLGVSKSLVYKVVKKGQIS